jgi:protein-tyrosine kinase
MGRVEDALRRAAEGRAENAQAPAPAVAGLVDPSFPTEFADAPLVHDSTPDGTPVLREQSGDEVLTAGEVSAEGSARMVGNNQMLTVSREQYRRLAASLHHMQTMNGVKVILVVSALAGEGKTLTASNLALTFSESYDRDVLLIDADLRRPSLARTFGIQASPGLSDGLAKDFKGRLTPQRVSDRLTVLPAGRPMPDPMAGFTSAWMRQLIAEARESFDWVIIDTPPIGLMTDANLLSSMSDGVVLVVKANATPYQLVKRAVDAIGPDRLLGAVLNRATEKGHSDRYYYYDYRHYAQAPGDGAKT